MKILRYLLYPILAVVGIFAFLLIYGTLSDYKPEDESMVYESPEAPVIEDSLFRFMIWNIGYCGLGEEMDFFKDGGKGVRSLRQNVEANLENVLQFVDRQDSVDFLLFQEVDVESKRSYRIDQLAALQDKKPEFHSALGKNFDVFFIPIPFSHPYGSVLSGIATLGRYSPYLSTRHTFPGNFPWPTGVFMLDRCFLVNRYPLMKGKELLVINTHNSAYDDGTLRKGQMEYLHGFLLEEFGRGNYVVVAGDWNQTPQDFEPAFQNNIFDTLQLTYVEKDFLPGDWTWVYDTATPTNRRVDIPYDPEVTRTTVIDYYLLSPNLEATEVETVNLDFVNSDHQPVFANIILK